MTMIESRQPALVESDGQSLPRFSVPLLLKRLGVSHTRRDPFLYPGCLPVLCAMVSQFAFVVGDDFSGTRPAEVVVCD